MKRLRDAYATDMSKVAVADDDYNNTVALGMENRMIGGKYDEGAL